MKDRIPGWVRITVPFIALAAAIEVAILVLHDAELFSFGLSRPWSAIAEVAIETLIFTTVAVPLLYYMVVAPLTTARRSVLQKEREAWLRLEEGSRIGRLGYWSTDLATGAWSWSPECHRILEVDSGHFDDRGTPYSDMVHPEDLPMLREAFVRIGAEGGGYDVLHRVLLDSGETKWMRSKAEAVQDKDGAVVSIRGIIQDQMETMGIEDTLRENEERFRLTFEQAAVGMAHIDPSGRWLRANRTLCAMLGYSEMELLRLSFQDLTYSEDVETDIQNMRTAIAGEISEYKRRKRYIHKDGSDVWVDLTVSVARWDDGAARYFIVVVEEIGAKLRAERALAERTAQLESVMANVDQGIGMTDSDGRIVAANNAYFTLVDVSPDQFTPGTPLREWLAFLADRGEFGDGNRQEILDAALKRADPKKRFRHQRTRPNGVVLEIDGNPTPEGGRVTTFTDITEKKRMEAELSKALREAEEANRAKSDFLATMSHELRTPLNAILGFAEILSHQYFGPIGQSRYVEYAEDIETSGRYLLELINDVLDISKIEAGEYMLSVGPLNVAAVIDDSVTLMSHRAETAGIHIAQAVETDLPEVMADRRAVKQMLLNLLSNALKFTDPGGKVSVSARLKGGKHEIIVQDTGRGIEAEEIPFLLEPFKTGRDNPEVSVESAGLGLAITNSLARLHSGSVTVDSMVGRGTTVTIRLPILEPRRDAPARLPRIAAGA